MDPRALVITHVKAINVHFYQQKKQQTFIGILVVGTYVGRLRHQAATLILNTGKQNKKSDFYFRFRFTFVIIFTFMKVVF